MDLHGIQAQTHTTATGPVNDLELALFRMKTAVWILVLANAQRYDDATLSAMPYG